MPPTIREDLCNEAHCHIERSFTPDEHHSGLQPECFTPFSMTQCLMRRDEERNFVQHGNE